MKNRMAETVDYMIDCINHILKINAHFRSTVTVRELKNY